MSEKVTADVTFTCYHCKKKCSVAIKGHDGNPSVIHELPTCSAYDAIQSMEDGTEYIRRCRLNMMD